MTFEGLSMSHPRPHVFYSKIILAFAVVSVISGWVLGDDSGGSRFDPKEWPPHKTKVVEWVESIPKDSTVTIGPADPSKPDGINYIKMVNGTLNIEGSLTSELPSGNKVQAGVHMIVSAVGMNNRVTNKGILSSAREKKGYAADVVMALTKYGDTISNEGIVTIQGIKRRTAPTAFQAAHKASEAANEINGTFNILSAPAMGFLIINGLGTNSGTLNLSSQSSSDQPSYGMKARNQNVHDFGVEQGNAEVRNRGTLNVNGKNNYGMAATADASNPPPVGYSSTAANWATINVSGDDSVGMSTDTHRAKVDNSGDIFTKDNAIGIKISGNGQLVNAGTIRGTGTGLLYSGNFPRGLSIKPGYVIEGSPAIKMEQASQSPLYLHGGFITGNIESASGEDNTLYIALPEEVPGKNTTLSIKGNISGFSTIKISGSGWSLSGWISEATRFDTSSQINSLFVSDTIASSHEVPDASLRFATTSESQNKLDINTEGGGKVESLNLFGSAQLNHLPELKHIAVYHSGNWSVSPVAPLPDLLTITAGSGGQIEEITTKRPSNKSKSLYLSFSQSTLVARDLVVHSLPESIIKTIDLSSKDDRKPLLLFLEGGETGTIKGRSDLNDKFVLNKGSVTEAVNDISTITVTSDNADAWSATGPVYNPNSININDGAQINSINTHSSRGSDRGALSLAFNRSYTNNDFIKVDNQGKLGSLDFSSDAERPRLWFLQQGQTAAIKGRSDKQDELELKTGSVKGTVDNIHTVRVTGREWTVLNWLTGTQKVDLQSPVHQIRIADKKEQGTLPGSTLGLVNSNSPISITSHADQQSDLWLRGKAQISDLHGVRNILLDSADVWSVTGSVPNPDSITITPYAKVSSINTRSSHGDNTLSLTFNGTYTDDNFFKVDNRGTLERLDFSNGAKRPPLQLSLKGGEMGVIKGHPDRDDQLILNTGSVTGEVNNIRTINVTGKAWTFLNWAVGTRQVILESPVHQIRVSDKKQQEVVPGATLNLITSNSPVSITSHADQQTDLWLRGKANISDLKGVRNILLDSAEDWSVNGSVYNSNAITISPEAQVSSINTHSTHLNRGNSDKTLTLLFNGTYKDDNVFKVDNSGTLGSLDFSSNANRPPLQFSLKGGEVKEIKGRSDKNDELILDKGSLTEAVNDIHTIRVTGREWTFLNWATGTHKVDLHSLIQRIRVSDQREQTDEEWKKGLPAATLGIITRSNPVSITSHADKQTDLWLQGEARITDLEGARGIWLDSAKDWSVTGQVLNPDSITIRPGAQVKNISTHSGFGTQSLALVFKSIDADDDFKVDNYGTLESLDLSAHAQRPSLKLSQKGGEIVKEIKGRSDKNDELILDSGSVKRAVDSIHTIRVTGKKWDFLDWATNTRQVTLESPIHQIRVYDKKDQETVPEETLSIISDKNHPVIITSHADKQADLWLKGEAQIRKLQGARHILLDSADAWSVSGQVNNPSSITISPDARVSSINTRSTYGNKTLAVAFNGTFSNNDFFKVDNHGTLASLDFSSDAHRPSLQFIQSGGAADLVKARPGMNDTLVMVAGTIREQSGFDNLIVQGDTWGYLRMDNLDLVNLVKGAVVNRITDDPKVEKGTDRLVLGFKKSLFNRSAFAINNEGGEIHEIDLSGPDSARPKLFLNHLDGITENIKGQQGHGDSLFLSGGKITGSVSGIDDVSITGKQWETIAIQNPLSITVTEDGTARLITTRDAGPAGGALTLPLKFTKSAVLFKKVPLNTRGTIKEMKFDDTGHRPPINIVLKAGTIGSIRSLPGKGDSLDVQNSTVEGDIIGLDSLTFSGPEAQFGGQLIETMGTVSISGKLTLTSNLKLSVTPVKFLQSVSEAESDTSTALAKTTVHINKGGTLYPKAPSAALSSRRDSALEVAGLYKQEGTLVVTLDELRDLKAPYIKASRIEVGPEAGVLLNNQPDIGESTEYLLMQSSDCDIKTMPSLVTTSFTPHTLYYLRLTARQLFLVSYHVATFVADLARSGGANDSALKAIEIALTTRQSNDSEPLNNWILSQVKMINNNTAEVAKIVNQMTPDLSGASISSANASIRQARTAVGARQTGLRNGIAAGDMVASGNVWMQYANTDARQDKKDGYNGYEAKTHGFTMGVDSDLNERMTLGVAYTYSKGDVNGTDGSSSRIDTEGHTFSVYSSFAQGSVFVDGRIGYSWSNNDGKRNVVGNEIKAKHDLNSWDVGLLTGYKMPLGQSGEWHWLPQLAFNYASIKPDDYRETSVNDWSDILRFARVKSDTYEILELGAGLKLSGDITTASMTVKPEVSLMAFHDFKDDPVSMTAQFAQGGNAFLMSGAKREQSRYQFDAVINMESHSNLAFTISYHYDWMDSFKAYGFIARVSYGF
ncbi:MULTISPECIES: autotransporter outer membrane beta-barrel domain-containing protein [unclassified Endozoicomonas]|uniref:autotransporter outer membrane beta-barrel domain-containing protein n=1 Tax=unclassified Endozoicomonas TaxID=2644528 RepID=UPI003BB6A686